MLSGKQSRAVETAAKADMKKEVFDFANTRILWLADAELSLIGGVVIINNILRDEHVLQCLGFELGERGGKRTEVEKKLRDVVPLSELTASREVVLPAEGDHAALALVAVEVKFLEG